MVYLVAIQFRYEPFIFYTLNSEVTQRHIWIKFNLTHGKWMRPILNLMRWYFWWIGCFFVCLFVCCSEREVFINISISFVKKKFNKLKKKKNIKISTIFSSVVEISHLCMLYFRYYESATSAQANTYAHTHTRHIHSHTSQKRQ